MVYLYINNIIAPAYSAAEEFTNALTHGIGFLISVAALIYMISIMPAHYSPLHKTGAVAYANVFNIHFVPCGKTAERERCFKTP